MAVPELSAAADYVRPSADERAFCDRFLPGPVTVLLERTGRVPDELVAGRDRVGIRVPEQDTARALARRTGPITATSANRSGEPSATRPEGVARSIRDRATVIDGGETPGTESTVVDVSRAEIIRRGALADEIEAWLADA
jgi:L-threonylcarbamoyladenylate synthase